MNIWDDREVQLLRGKSVTVDATALYRLVVNFYHLLDHHYVLRPTHKSSISYDELDHLLIEVIKVFQNRGETNES